MTRGLGLTLAGVIFCAMSLALAESTTVPQGLDALEKQVGQWVDLRKAISDEQRAWDDEQAQLQQLRQVLALEKEQLVGDIATLRQAQEATTGRRAAAEEALAAMEPLLAPWDELLAQAGEMVERTFQAIPAALTAAHAEAWTPVTADADRVRQLQQVLFKFALLEGLQHEIHSVREVLEFAGGRWAMDVLYLGTARAFAVNAEGSFAAVGHPVAGVWEWKASPEIAPDVRVAIRIHRREKPARLIRLPLASTTAEAP